MPRDQEKTVEYYVSATPPETPTNALNKQLLKKVVETTTYSEPVHDSPVPDHGSVPSIETEVVEKRAVREDLAPAASPSSPSSAQKPEDDLPESKISPIEESMAVKRTEVTGMAYYLPAIGIPILT